jgi:hypothetical protein
MKRADFSNARPGSHSGKICCCGGHSSKARKPKGKLKPWQRSMRAHDLGRAELLSEGRLIR